MKERAAMFTVASSALAGPREHTLPACLPKTGKWWKGEEGGVERSQDMVRQSVTGSLQKEQGTNGGELTSSNYVGRFVQ